MKSLSYFKKDYINIKFLFFGFMLFFMACETKTKISNIQIKEIVEYLASDELNGRKTGSKGIDKAATFIEKKFKSYGVKPYFQAYRDSFKIAGIDAYNVVGYIEGNDPKLKNEVVIIGAHYDHIGYAKKIENDSIANGANDNAAGTSAVLSLSNYFSQKNNNKRSLIFALFSAEEMGLVQSGARHLADTLKYQGIDLYTMVNFEMIGVPMKDKKHDAYLTGYNLSNMGEKINKYANSNLVGFLPKAEELDLFRRSDNYSFYKVFNLPCQTISTFDFTNYEYYHTVKDETINLDFRHITSLINKIIPAIGELCCTPSKEIKLK